MPNTVEIDRRGAELLYDLLVIKGLNRSIKVRGLERAILRAKISLTVDQIAWVEKLAAETVEIDE